MSGNLWERDDLPSEQAMVGNEVQVGALSSYIDAESPHKLKDSACRLSTPKPLGSMCDCLVVMIDQRSGDMFRSTALPFRLQGPQSASLICLTDRWS